MERGLRPKVPGPFSGLGPTPLKRPPGVPKPDAATLRRALFENESTRPRVHAARVFALALRSRDLCFESKFQARRKCFPAGSRPTGLPIRRFGFDEFAGQTSPRSGWRQRISASARLIVMAPNYRGDTQEITTTGPYLDVPSRNSAIAGLIIVPRGAGRLRAHPRPVTRMIRTMRAEATT